MYPERDHPSEMIRLSCCLIYRKFLERVRKISVLVKPIYLNLNSCYVNEKLLVEGRVNGLLLYEFQQYEQWSFIVLTLIGQR